MADVDLEYASSGARAFMSARVRCPRILATFSGRAIDALSLSTRRSAKHEIGGDDLSLPQVSGIGGVVGFELGELVHEVNKQPLVCL